MLEFCFGTYGYDLKNPSDCNKLLNAGIHEISIDYECFMGSDISRKDVEQFADQLKNTGLSAKTSHPPFGSFNEPFSLLRQKKDGLKYEIEWMQEFLIRCGILGIKSIPLHTGGAMLPKAEKWEIQCAKEYVTALLPYAEQSNVVIAIENTNHANPVNFYPGVEDNSSLNKNIWEFDDTERIIEFVGSFCSPWVRICYDTGHSHLLGKMMDDYYAFNKYIVMFHIHDNDGYGCDSHLQPGYGNADWHGLFGEISAMQDKPVIYIEAKPFYNDLSLELKELEAIVENRVVVKPGGFLKKHEDTGKILIMER